MKKIKGLDCILLVDDSEPTNFFHQMIIKKAGLDAIIQIVKNGLEALEFLTRTGAFQEEKKYPQPGIIFLDINMPIMNGWEFLNEYEKLPKDQKGNIVIIMVTSSLNDDDLEKAQSNPDTKGFINKPLEIEDVKKLIAEHFKQEL